MAAPQIVAARTACCQNSSEVGSAYGSHVAEHEPLQHSWSRLQLVPAGWHATQVPASPQ
jgi:hypothetical protein